MHTKQRIIIAFVVVIAAIFSYFSYSIIKSRYFSAEESTNTEQNTSTQTIQTDSPAPIQMEEIKQTTFIDISSSDCDKHCSSFVEPKALQYCQEICGLATVKKPTECGNLTELEKDYCLKQLAVDKGDFTICAQIEDSGINKSCKDRITEDILDNSL